MTTAGSQISYSIIGCTFLAILCQPSSLKAEDVIENILPNLDSSISQSVNISSALIYDTNPLFSRKEQDVWIGRVQPRYQIQHNDERSDQYLDFSILLQRSSDNAISVDREDPSLKFGFTRLMANGTFTADAGISKRSTRLTQVNETGLLADDGSVINYFVNTAASYLFNPRLTGNLGLSYSSSRFKEAAQQLRNFETFTVNHGWSYVLNELFTTKANISGTENRLINSKAYLINSMVGAVWTPSLNLEMQMLAGLNHTITEGQQDKTGFAIDANAIYSQEFDTYSASFARSVRPSGLGLQESDRLNLSVVHAVNDSLKLGVTYQQNINKNFIQTETRIANFSINKKINSQWNLNVYMKNKQIDGAVNNAQANVLGITIGYGNADSENEY